MGAYHQLGHHSWNLIDVEGLEAFRGIILSPVNYSPTQTQQQLAALKRRQFIEVVLDPQFYKPNSERGQLNAWGHFNTGMDTTDLGDIQWWHDRNTDLVAAAKSVGADAVCSLAVVPRQYSDDYYRWIADRANDLAGLAAGQGLSVLISAIVPIGELAQPNRALAISSVLTSCPNIGRIYLVLVDDLPPRQPRSDIGGLGGAVELIRLLEEAGMEVTVAFSGLDLVLWKAAGATNVATGKFLNLRRFTFGRWDDQDEEGGRVVPYWTDNEFVTWLREADLVMLLRQGLINRELVSENPFSREILAILDAAAGAAWVGLGWRQHLWWAQNADASLHKNADAARVLLEGASAKWAELRERKLYLFEADRNAAWVTSWLNALAIGGV